MTIIRPILLAVALCCCLLLRGADDSPLLTSTRTSIAALTWSNPDYNRVLFADWLQVQGKSDPAAHGVTMPSRPFSVEHTKIVSQREPVVTFKRDDGSWVITFKEAPK